MSEKNQILMEVDGDAIPFKPTFSGPEIQKLLNISDETLHLLRRRGFIKNIPGIKSPYQYSRAELKRFIAGDIEIKKKK